ncbi:hypothetical protein ACVLD2_004595 [Paenibacillus sp. PvR052]
MYHPAVASAPGSVPQVRECTGHFMCIAKGEVLQPSLLAMLLKRERLQGRAFLSIWWIVCSISMGSAIIRTHCCVP